MRAPKPAVLASLLLASLLLAVLGVPAAEAIPPTIDSIMVSSPAIDEGDMVTVSGTFSDPDGGTHTGTASWSDGPATSVTVSTGTFSTVRTVQDDDPTGTGSDDITVVITISDGSDSDSESSPTITVDNVDPSIDSIMMSPSSIQEGETAMVSGTFSDSGTLDTHTATATWSDSVMTSVTVDTGAGTFSTMRTFPVDYLVNGGISPLTVSVTIIDDDFGTDSDTSPQLEIFPLPVELQSFSID